VAYLKVVIMLIEDRMWEAMPIIGKWIQVLRPRNFLDVETPKASTWNSTSALIAEPDNFPETSVSAEIHSHVQARIEVNMYCFRDIKSAKKVFLL
jgi:hypothetical protein